MKSFKQFLAEMARDTGQGFPSNYSQKDTWDSMKGTEFVKLIVKDIGSNRYKLYKSPGGFYLADEKDNYKGSLIQKDNNNKEVFEIQTSNKTEDVKGFYKIMFTTILGNTDFKEILSDYRLSSEAIGAYINLSKHSYLKVRLKLYGRFLDDEFTKENLTKNVATVVSITEGSNLKEHFNDYYERINSMEGNSRFPTGFRSEFLKRGKGIDNFLFCEIKQEDE